ncbi:MAG: nicotinate-nucleotide adenylyltransferase [Chitinophagales bacterium]
MSAIGVFGGTFDPVHIGHLAAAERVRCELGMEQIIFVPAMIPPHKLDRKISSGEHRLKMLIRATTDNPFFVVDDCELRSEEPSYTVRTMQYFRRKYQEDELFFIMGMDNLLDLDTWYNPEELISICRLVVVARPGYKIENTDEVLERLPETIWEKTTFLQVPGLDISATDIRVRLGKGQSVRYLLPDSVKDYIFSSGLYGVKKIER